MLRIKITESDYTNLIHELIHRYGGLHSNSKLLYFTPHGFSAGTGSVFHEPDCTMFNNEPDVQVSDPDIHQGRLHGGYIVVMQPGS